MKKISSFIPRLLRKINGKSLTPVPHKQIEGFSLIEISIGLVIIGILFAGIFKGVELMDSARLQTTIQDLSRYKMASDEYQRVWGDLPGKDKSASKHFGGNGMSDGDGRTVPTEKFWQHMNGFQKSIPKEAPKIMGGSVFAESDLLNLSGHYLMLAQSKEGKGLLTPKQARNLKAKAGESGDPESGQFLIVNGKDEGETCVKNGQIDTTQTKPSCVVLVSLN